MRAGDPTERGGGDSASLSSSAIRGSLALSSQWLLNKVATAGATLIIAHFLAPEDYGVARTALSVVTFLMLPPLVLGDVLVARSRALNLLSWTARRLALAIGGASTCLILLAVPMVLRAYDSYSGPWLGALLAALALRPLLQAVQTVPVSDLRYQLRFRRIALIEGLTQLAATAVSVAFAVAGGGPASIVVPQLLREAATAALYVRIAPVQQRTPFRRRAACVLLRNYLTAAGGQYVHGLVMNVAIVAVGYFAGHFQAGLFGFSFVLAAQANTVIVGRLGVVLQPVLAKLRTDPTRQVHGFLRAQRALGSVCVPAALLQAVVAEPLFQLLLDPKWQPAVPVFQALSLMQALYFASAPSMACLKAQGRFRTLLLWQAVHLLASLGAYWFASRRFGAVGAAAAGVILWAISAPAAIWICSSFPNGGPPTPALRVLLKPLAIGLPVFGPGYLAISRLAELGPLGNLLALPVLGPLLLAVALLITHRVEPEFRSLTDRAFGWLRERMSA